MAGGKETPRQKMIGMMYLVLTALLAMNVSKDILDAFALVDVSLTKTENTLEAKNNATMGEFQGKLAANRDKTQPFYTQAEEVTKRADELTDYINDLKARTITVSHKANALSYGEGFEEYQIDGGRTVNMTDVDADGKKYIKKPDENQENTTLLIGSDPANPKDDQWSARELRTKLEQYRDYLKGIKVREVTGKEWTVPESIVTSLDNLFSFPNTTEDEKEVTWETKNFFHNPLAAILPLLTKLQVDVQNAKADVLAAMLSGIEGKSYKFTNLAPFVIPESNYILRGDTFRARILLAAYDGTNPPDIFVDRKVWDMKDSTRIEANDDMKIKISPEGLGVLKIPTSGMALGDAAYKGMIRYAGPLGTEEYSVYVPPFTVAEPALVISPSKMNVFYRGLPNPVEISVPGVPQDKISPSISGGHTITKSGGEWIVQPGSGGEATISVMAEINGVKQRMGEKKFRVKAIPDPVPVFAGKKPTDSTVPLNDMKVAAGVRAEMENFDFEVDVRVKSFSMIFVRDGNVIQKDANDNKVTNDMKVNMDRVKRGDKFYIENIIVKMPDKTDRKVANLSLKAV